MDVFQIEECPLFFITLWVESVKSFFLFFLRFFKKKYVICDFILSV